MNEVTAKPANSLLGRRRLVPSLIAVVLALVCLGSIVAWVIYADAHNSVSPSESVTTTRDILLDLAGVSQQLDRVELDVRLYRVTEEEDHLRAAQTATVALNTIVERLKEEVSGDPDEERRAADLQTAELALTAGVSKMFGGSAPVRDQVLVCRRIANLMQDEERRLLKAGEADEERNDLYGLARRTSVIVVGAGLILILFGFLVRDIIQRGRFEDQISEANERLSQTVQRLEQQAAESRLLIAARDEVGLCQEVKLAEAVFVRYLNQLLPGTAGCLCIINHSRQQMETAGTWGGAEPVTFEGFAPDTCCALRSGKIRWRRPERSEVHCTHFAGKAPERYICLPLTAHGETLGIVTMELTSPEIAALAEARESTLVSLGEMAAMTISGLNLRQKLENQSIRDGLTGLFNRSFMEIALEREINRAARQGKQIAVMMLDIDHFKDFNDSFGHEAGDLVLRHVAEAMRVGIRGEDIACRYGGEEFVIILPEISTRAAADRAEVLRRMVADLTLRYRGEPLRQVTISIGMAMCPENGETEEELLRCADHAMYAAKHKGRNKVVTADSSIRA
ncbi:MAG TPA: diguanylate cyclase [Acidobacteriaceae bacterium]